MLYQKEQTWTNMDKNGYENIYINKNAFLVFYSVYWSHHVAIALYFCLDKTLFCQSLLPLELPWRGSLNL